MIGPGTGTSGQLCQRCSDQIPLSHFTQEKSVYSRFEHQYQRQAAYIRAIEVEEGRNPPYPRYDSQRAPRGKVSRADQRKVGSKRATGSQLIISVKGQKRLYIALVHSDSGDSLHPGAPYLIGGTPIGSRTCRRSQLGCIVTIAW
jgi:hypothetical protein